MRLPPQLGSGRPLSASVERLGNYPFFSDRTSRASGVLFDVIHREVDFECLARSQFTQFLT